MIEEGRRRTIFQELSLEEPTIDEHASLHDRQREEPSAWKRYKSKLPPVVASNSLRNIVPKLKANNDSNIVACR